MGGRGVSPLVLNTEVTPSSPSSLHHLPQGQSVLMPRYLRPLPPPPGVLGRGEGEPGEAIAWFVSLLPHTPTNAYFPGLGDVWPTSEEFLRVMVGTQAEHAVLLTNFLAGLGRTAYLVVGRGVPEGRSLYCLTVEVSPRPLLQESGEHRLWNPVTGEHFATQDTFLPLR